jgi:DNA-binding CsgD family transcriptional regulator
MTTLQNPSLFNSEIPLTPREFQVCYELVTTTLSQKEIAAKLGKSLRTVNLQATSGYKKLGVTSRFELIQRFGKGKEVQVSYLSSRDVVHRIMQKLDEIERVLNDLLTRKQSSHHALESSSPLTDSKSKPIRRSAVLLVHTAGLGGPPTE